MVRTQLLRGPQRLPENQTDDARWGWGHSHPDSKVHVAHLGPTWVLSAPGRPHVGPMNLAIMANWGWAPTIPAGIRGSCADVMFLLCVDLTRFAAVQLRAGHVRQPLALEDECAAGYHDRTPHSSQSRRPGIVCCCYVCSNTNTCALHGLCSGHRNI